MDYPYKHTVIRNMPLELQRNIVIIIRLDYPIIQTDNNYCLEYIQEWKGHKRDNYSFDLALYRWWYFLFH